METIKAALLGAGIFSRDVYAKVFADNSESVELSQVWSRTAAAAQEFVAKFAPTAQAQHGNVGLASILQDPTVQVVVVVLPPQAALPVVRQALAAGKHVIEEKPVAGQLELALAAIKEHRDRTDGPLWMLAENYRYEDVFVEACTLAPGVLGTLIKLDLTAEMAMDYTNKYYPSQWRRDTEGCAGGMITESSVHFIAALRMLAAACGLGEAAEVSARTNHVRSDLSGPDSVVGSVRFIGGAVSASVSITLAASQVHWSLRAVGTDGSLEVSRGGWTGSRACYTLTWKSRTGTEPQSKTFSFSGVGNAFTAFINLVKATQHAGAKAVRGSPEEARASPEEGARDLALVLALLESGAKGGVPVPVTAT